MPRKSLIILAAFTSGLLFTRMWVYVHKRQLNGYMLSEGGKIEMPLETTFWNAYFGMFSDKFGIQWMVNYDLNLMDLPYEDPY